MSKFREMLRGVDRWDVSLIIGCALATYGLFEYSPTIAKIVCGTVLAVLSLKAGK